MTLSAKLCAFLILVALLLWWFHRSQPENVRNTPEVTSTAQLIPFRTPGGTLHTNGFVKTEILRKATGSWFGTTSSSIRFNACYRYEIELRSARWNILLDDARKVAFVVAPPFRPQLPVAIDSRTVEEWTESGWGRFNKWEHLRALREKTTPALEKLARSNGYLEIARGQARTTVEEFVSDWLLKSRGWPKNSAGFVKVYFADELDIPFPDDKSLKDFLP